MLFFAHTGIALGAATIITGGMNNRNKKVYWFVSLSKYLDIRLFLIGSLLPDIIDKPVGIYLFYDFFHTGRIFTHTLLFLVQISAIGFYLYKAHRQIWMLSLAAGTLAHLLLDQMWRIPATLFWPFMGFTFKAEELNNYADSLLHALFTKPELYITEISGLAILLWFGITVIRRKQVSSLIKNGRIS